MGGSFRLITHEGKTLTEADLRGQPFAVFFGFMHCPDICPTTLLEMSNLLRELGPEGDRLGVLFITVDPERDTPELLSSFVRSFDRRITALTGSEAEIAAAAKVYRAGYRKVPSSAGTYTMEHTAAVYLMTRWGNSFDILQPQENHPKSSLQSCGDFYARHRPRFERRLQHKPFVKWRGIYPGLEETPPWRPNAPPTASHHLMCEFPRPPGADQLPPQSIFIRQ